MTDEQINIKIAEACGWSELNVSHMGAVTSAIPPKELYKRDRREIPNYTSDLNAMHEAEKTLTHEQSMIWISYLDEVCGFDGLAARRATARQRALAFLTTLNL